MKALRYLILLSALAAPIAASTVVKMNFAQLSRAAHNVVAGQIIDITAEKDPASGYIYSRVTLSVSQAVPATLVGRPYTFNMIGGTLNGKRLHIAGFPRLERDQKVILFLNSRTKNVFGPTTGLWQGVFFVKPESAGGTEMITDHEGYPIVSIEDHRLIRRAPPAPESKDVVVSGPQPARLAVTDFFDTVRANRVLTLGTADVTK